MGGHAAWKKRVANGGLMKGSGGAACRHHPRLGRRGADLKLNRKGNLGGFPNPKKVKKKKKEDDEEGANENISNRDFPKWFFEGRGTAILIKVLVIVIALYAMFGVTILLKRYSKLE